VSLAIDTDHVTAVLLTDGWHHVTDQSFDVDSFEFLYWGRTQCKDHDDPVIVHGGGRSGVCAAGFAFRTDDGTHVAGPLTAVLAVRYTTQPCANPVCDHEDEEAA
jgi:hypothetical protein